MTNKEILEKAIKKAINGGWKGIARSTYYYPTGKDLLKWRWENDNEVWSDGEYETYETLHPFTVIFSQDFAKALWGDEQHQFHINRS